MEDSNSKKRVIIGAIIIIVVVLAVILVVALKNDNKEENKDTNIYNSSINEGMPVENVKNDENGAKPTVIPDEPTVQAPSDITQIPMNYNEEFESVNTND